MRAERQVELSKYRRAYRESGYRMQGQRLQDAIADLRQLPARGSYLDVSTGRGEMLVHARALGFDPTFGTECVPELMGEPGVSYALAHELPFGADSIDVVTMFDVIEHLLPGDDQLACLELRRVARQHILISANNRRSFNRFGDDLHINKRPYDEWERLLRTWFQPFVRLTRLAGENRYVSATWRVDL